MSGQAEGQRPQWTSKETETSADRQRDRAVGGRAEGQRGSLQLVGGARKEGCRGAGNASSPVLLALETQPDLLQYAEALGQTIYLELGGSLLRLF